MSQKIYTTGCSSWYTDPDTGKVTALAPCRQFTWRKRCRFPVMSDMIYDGVKSKPLSYLPWSQQIGIMLGRGQIPDHTTQSNFAAPFRACKLYLDMKVFQAIAWFFDTIVEWDFPDHDKFETLAGKKLS
ncbi:hypothetical protein FA10DRAFT_297689 [Acaromyces ingoldii]|uniref:Uncharacterized protein n=1 Tax=Acaromyces ingoldii TaxID=215250 RepID=A0A316YAU2_9BASI|nr:hypothetical protein FA10DRAFT_297689 [Acaromyces ingoldii]PWN86727.1 hypothetical protein FA10DRAFT_297689 [Acaromyces ingoldii]